MEQVKDDLNVATITKTQTSTRARNYQKYFDVATTVTVNRQVKNIAYSRAKVVLITAYCVFTLLLALVITNFILMSSLTNSINASKLTYQNEISTSEYYINAINDATSEKTVMSKLNENGYVEGEKQVVEIAPIYIATETSEVQEQTNWFNEFTKFISQVFGG